MYQEDVVIMVRIASLTSTPTAQLLAVKPHFTVTLDDVLSNKHLPPLSATVRFTTSTAMCACAYTWPSAS